MKPNNYPGNCDRCGVRLAAGAGMLVKVEGKWAVRHPDACPETPATPVKDGRDPAPTTKLAPTDEQRACLDLFAEGGSMVIQAGAGTGKTSTLRLLAESAPEKRMLYVAYNKAIVVDVGDTMPRNVTCSTAHSLAWKAIVGPSEARKLRLKTGRQRRVEVASRLGIDAPMAFKMEDGAPPKMISPAALAGYVMRALARFCQTADEHPDRSHFGRVEAIDLPERWENNNDLQIEMLAPLERAWADIQREDGWLRFEHDHYLKLWQLTHPRLAVDVVMLDEAQDADPVIAAIVAEQSHAQRVYVGDANQEIYAWRGAVNALAQVDVAHQRFLTQSFRFGPAIAAVANELLAGLSVPTPMRLTGLPTINSVVGPLATADAVLCRSNACALEEVLDAYNKGLRPFLVGGGKEVAAFARAALDLQAGRGTEHPELSCFDTWGEVVAFVDQDEQGDELRLMVKLVEEFGARTILSAVDGLADESEADVIVSTAHKAKGREWSRVRLAGDFAPRDDENGMDDSEIRLRYVACTRARDHLDHTALAPKKPKAAPTIEELLGVARAAQESRR